VWRSGLEFLPRTITGELVQGHHICGCGYCLLEISLNLCKRFIFSNCGLNAIEKSQRSIASPAMYSLERGAESLSPKMENA
jgi:hypothetical protein